MLSLIFLKLVSLMLWLYIIGATILMMITLVKFLLKRFVITKRHIIFVLFWIILIFAKEFDKERKDILDV